MENELQVEISTLVGNSRVSIISLQGQVLKQVAVSPGPNKINTKDLPRGLYLLHLHHSHYQTTLKFRKQ
ncbi:MAG: T9SS type A sorting domain-containing protein [Owenweeksia sp.]|nr:T9SS type A sorting domain-containing protein [Owenweeksia sp.]